jgi:pSer/pThr/pTyr-binding forkhead associated (FHA) protein
MKVNLVVMSAGPTKGKVIPVKLAQFLIGRDPHCQLRPASPLISNRHCALLLRDGKVFIRDFESTNGTFINDVAIKGEKELKKDDRLRIGPLEFAIQVESPPTVDRKTPMPQTKVLNEVVDDEAAAALLLSLQEEGTSAPDAPVDSEGIPTGSTVMDLPAIPPGQQSTQGDGKKEEKDKAQAKNASGDTSAAAGSILQKYLRRGRKTT